ncbi:hypothetical protein ING2D1G_0720 [Peptoniphilus sp. ING2-D1G]|nr:hypothetical protein ING2D1G_0720 [Peptoniphilus sp. ING2-D1G]
MIPIEQLSKRAKKLYDDINSAKLYINGQAIDGVIKKKTIKDNAIKVFVALSSDEGTIEKIEIYDIDGDLLQVQDMQVVKSNHYKFLAVVEIRVENEVENGR